jgi:hypothetical protein
METRGCDSAEHEFFQRRFAADLAGLNGAGGEEQDSDHHHHRHPLYCSLIITHTYQPMFSSENQDHDQPNPAITSPESSALLQTLVTSKNGLNGASAAT